MIKSFKKFLKLIHTMEKELGYKISEILNMSPLEFKTFVDSMQDPKKLDREIESSDELTTLDQAFPGIFSDPFANK
ncbi:hypothetical protein F6I25_00885 [Lactobacillus jensenii]|nr:hypothetical protein [Lactobacillus mulieris]EEX24481.1 hypothetical protein HMPREF0974_00286 [Lactobacillus jensenii 115-3-CHN]KAA9369849.1 hypothetical protein F6I25_00885 [Lactobacillus jensenii]KAA9371398.1 hypothetical protein F6I07_06405 [Lactobacillus jensenii]MCZ3875637.1 hypothetical protein [Lactobacillus mulieris]MDK8082206.1 hypothetical protein [Lactobacillus mulieris]